MKTAAHVPAKLLAPRSSAFTPAPTGLVQRKCACGGSTGVADQCGGCRNERLPVQRRPAEAASASVRPVHLDVRNSIRRLTDSIARFPTESRLGHHFSHVRVDAADSTHRDPSDSGGPIGRFVSMPTSSGSPLPDSARLMLEERFRTSLLDVRIHSDEAAGDKAIELGAKAFTRGRDIYFARGQFRPTTPAGVALLAHEITHVLQQRNGRSSRTGSSGHVARVQSSLEHEAAQVERSARYSTLPLEVHRHETNNEIHRSPAIQSDIRAGSASNIEKLADYLADATEGTDPITIQLNELRAALTGNGYLIFSPEAVTELEVIYTRFRALAPAWLPIPDVDLTPVPVQRVPIVVAGVAIGVVEILLLLAILVVIWLIITNLNPDVRRQREREVQRFIDAIKEAASKAPKRTPLPKTETGTTIYYEPEPEPEEPEEEPEHCIPKPKGALGGNWEHDELASYVTHSPFEYELTSPSGLTYQYDGMDEIGTLYEVKTRYEFLEVLGLPEQSLSDLGAVRVASGVSSLQLNTALEVAIAAECGFDFRIAVNDAEVAGLMRDLLRGIIDPRKIEFVDYRPTGR